MNQFFESLGRLWKGAAERHGVKIEEPELDPKVADELLQLAAVVSHTKERRFAPLATYTAGLAVGRLRDAKWKARERQSNSIEIAWNSSIRGATVRID